MKKCNVIELIKAKKKDEYIPFAFELNPLDFSNWSDKNKVFTEKEINDADNYFRETRCSNNSDLIEFSDGNHYCILHLPTFAKDDLSFLIAYSHRLNSIQSGIHDSPNYLTSQQLHDLSVKFAYDFRFVYFPCAVDFSEQYFGASVNFQGANFRKPVKFENCRFNDILDFSDAEFDSELDITSCMFREKVDFNNATFNQSFFFNNCRFLQPANFSNMLLQPETEFDAVGERVFENITFDQVNFNGVLNVEPIRFNNILFNGNADFSNMQAKNFIFYQCKFEQNAIFKDANFFGQSI
jgi:hypothetical protein